MFLHKMLNFFGGVLPPDLHLKRGKIKMFCLWQNRKEILTLKTSSIGFPVISVQMSCTGSPDNNMLHVSPGQKRTGERQGKNHCTKKKRWGKQSHKQIQKAKAKWQSTKNKGSAIWVWGKQMQPLLFSMWRSGISLWGAGNVTLACKK